MTFQKIYRLSVCLVSRDRTLLTKKTIESIYENSSLFNEINIYLFDNLSKCSDERISIFHNLLKTKKIKFYSYDTEDSLTKCFGKSIAFQRWLNMMKMDMEIRRKKYLNDGLTDYYLLIDNDMILGPNWDKYFITASQHTETEKFQKEFPNIYFLVKYPGGISLKNKKTHTVNNTFTNNEFKLEMSDSGGGSGLWFMNSNNLLKMYKLWNNSDILLHTFNRYKRHDVATWISIKNKLKDIDSTNPYYVGGVNIEDEHIDPIAMHLGGLKSIGSICKSMTEINGRDSKYNMLRKEEEGIEYKLDRLTIQQIINKFKSSKSVTNW